MDDTHFYNYPGAATLQYTTDYINGFVYITPGTGSAALSYFPMPEGRVLYNGSTFTQQFILTDPQGNARISFQNNGSGNVSVQQETSYYGFGYQMAGSLVALPPVPNKQLYNGGSEWQNDYSNLPDYDQTFYRNYDAALGRWVGIDPSAESVESMSSYQYAGDNPVMNNDPMGNKLNTPANWFNYGPSPLSAPERYGGDSDFSEDEGYTGGWVDYGSGGAYSPDADGSYTTAWNSILAGTGFSVGSNGQAQYNASDDKGVGNEASNIIAPYVGRDLYFSANGSLIGGIYNPSLHGGISAHMEGNTENDQEVITNDQLLHLIGDLPPIYAAGSDDDESEHWYDIGNKINAIWGAVTPFFKSSIAYMKEGSTYLNYYASGWAGGSRALIKIVKSARVAGAIGFAAGELMDVIELANGNIGWGKFGVDTAAGLLAFTEFAPVSIIYFGVDAFYKNGWAGVGKDIYNNYQNNVINPALLSLGTANHDGPGN